MTRRPDLLGALDDAAGRVRRRCSAISGAVPLALVELGDDLRRRGITADNLLDHELDALLEHRAGELAIILDATRRQ